MITNASHVGRVLETFDICETPIDNAFSDAKNIIVIRSLVTSLNCDEKVCCCIVFLVISMYFQYVLLDDGRRIEYTKICIANGASPKVSSET